MKTLPTIAAAFMLSAVAAEAATVTVEREAGTIHLSQYGIRDNTITIGSDLVGMGVVARFADGTSESMTWRQIMNARSGVDTTGLSIRYAGREWMLATTRALAGLEFDAASGNAIFDTIASLIDGDAGNTDGTSFGYPFEIWGGDPITGNVAVTYSDAMQMQGMPVGVDAFTRMSLDFSGLTGGAFLGSLAFSTDMDSLEVAGDLAPITTPLPAGMSLMLGGLALLGLQRRRRRG